MLSWSVHISPPPGGNDWQFDLVDFNYEAKFVANTYFTLYHQFSMANEDEFSDEYVAKLLAQDARECSIRYSTLGIVAFDSSKPNHSLRPNTRFLENVIRNTDSHNKAILAKEVAVSQERLRGLANDDDTEKQFKGEDQRRERSNQTSHTPGIGEGKRGNKINKAKEHGLESDRLDLARGDRSKGPDKWTRLIDPDATSRSYREHKRRDSHSGRREDTSGLASQEATSQWWERRLEDLLKRSEGKSQQETTKISKEETESQWWERHVRDLLRKAHREGQRHTLWPSDAHQSHESRERQRNGSLQETGSKEATPATESTMQDLRASMDRDERSRKEIDKTGRSRRDRHSTEKDSENHTDRHKSYRERSKNNEGMERYRARKARSISHSRSRSPREQRHYHRSSRATSIRDEIRDRILSSRADSEKPRRGSSSIRHVPSHRDGEVRNTTSSRSRTEKQDASHPAGLFKSASDSDPLDDIIGPRPPPALQIISRGRGITSKRLSSPSGIDTRFSSTYDPDLDRHPEAPTHSADGDDWDQALEALRDRLEWKQQGADRLRSAGFSEKDIETWKSGGEKQPADVRWTEKGGKREWDLGKVVDGDDGTTRLEPTWGRLKYDD